MALQVPVAPDDPVTVDVTGRWSTPPWRRSTRVGRPRTGPGPAAVPGSSDAVLSAVSAVVAVLTVLAALALTGLVAVGAPRAAVLLAGGSLLAMVVASGVVRWRPRRTVAAVVVLLDLAALLFALSQIVVGSEWSRMLPLLHLLATVLCALALPVWAVRAQVAVTTVSAAVIFYLPHRSDWGMAEAHVALLSVTLMVVIGTSVVVASIRGLLFELGAVVADNERRAGLDPLTSVLNRRGAATTLPDLIRSAQVQGGPVAVMVADLDHFKRVNDAHGHATGDAVLQATARALRASVRADDLVCRLGGEEFAIVTVLPAGATAADLRVVAERLRVTVDRANVLLGVSVSVGAVLRTPPSRHDGFRAWWDAALEAADRLLYEAKQAGRARCAVEGADGSATPPRACDGPAPAPRTAAATAGHVPDPATSPVGATARVSLVRRLFPTDGAALRGTAVLALAITPLSAVNVARNDLSHPLGAVLDLAVTATLAVTCVVVLVHRRRLSRAAFPVIVLLDLAATFYALSEALVPGLTFTTMLPLLHVLVTVLAALTLTRRLLRAQVAAVTLATGLVFLVGAWSSSSWAVLEALAGTGVAFLVFVSAAASVCLLLGQVEEHRRAAEHLMAYDPLTGALNRRGWEAAAARLVAGARSSGRAVAVLVADLDHFKRVNDTHGHATGDAVLLATAGAIRGAVRDDDAVARLGGEEFAVAALVGEEPSGIAERVRQAVNAANSHLGVTVSIGVAHRSPPPASPPPASPPPPAPLPPGTDPVEWLYRLVEEADERLYTAKRTGRNRCVWQATAEPPTCPAGRAGLEVT